MSLLKICNYMSVRITVIFYQLLKQCKEEEGTKHTQVSVLQETLNYSHMSLNSRYEK
jgi:hypothetical protein